MQLLYIFFDNRIKTVQRNVPFSLLLFFLFCVWMSLVIIEAVVLVKSRKLIALSSVTIECWDCSQQADGVWLCVCMCLCGQGLFQSLLKYFKMGY